MLKILNLIEKFLNLIEKILIEKNFNKINLIKEDSLLKKIFKIFIDYLRFVKGFFQKRFIYLAEYIEYYFDQPWTLVRIIFLCFKLVTLFTFVWFAFVFLCNLLSFFVKSFFFFLEVYYDLKKIKNNVRLKPSKIFVFLNYIADFRWYMFKYEYRAFKKRSVDNFVDYVNQILRRTLSFISSRPLYYQVSKIRLKKLYRRIRYFFFKGALKREIRRFCLQCKIIFIWIQKLCGIVRLRIIFSLYCLKWKIQWFYCWIFLKFGSLYLFFFHLVSLVNYYVFTFWINFIFWVERLLWLLFCPFSFSYSHITRILKSVKKIIIDRDLDMEYTKPKHKKKLTPAELKKFKEHLNLDQKKSLKK